MTRYFYPDGTHCCRALHTAHAVYRREDGRLIARAKRSDNSELHELQTSGFELVELGVRHD